MDAAFPVDDENDFAGLRVDIDDDVVDQGTNDALLQSRVGIRIIP
jgi:hypothetical protein